jgi:hypothetical protein
MTDVAVYYHDPVKAPLLRDAVLPALAAATRVAGVTGHLERHWLHGPHVRLRLQGQAEAQHAAAANAAFVLREYVEACPSTIDILDAELLAQASTAAVAELLKPPFEPLHANNSVRIEPTDTRRIHELLGSETLVDLRTTGLRLGTPAIEASLTEFEDSGAGRLRLAITAMAVHAGRYPPGLHHGYHSFLSHVEDFLLATDRDGRIRASFEKVWEDNTESVTEIVQRVAGGHPTTGAEAAWQAWTIGTRLAAEAVFDAGDLPTGPNPRYGERAYELGDPGAIRRYNFAERTEFSAYHTKLWDVDLEHPLIRRPLAVYRFGTNVLYQLLAICDVTPMERYLAASLVAAATQRLTGVRWEEHLDALAGQR